MTASQLPAPGKLLQCGKNLFVGQVAGGAEEYQRIRCNLHHLIPSGTDLFGYAKVCSDAMMLQLSDSTHLSELTVSLPELDQIDTANPSE